MQTETINNNALIAEFMGYKVEMYMSNPPRPVGFCMIKGEIKPMKFHSSWDWLMPVCKKICKTTPYNSYLAIETMSVFADIEDVYKAVVEFIEWHNNPISNE